MEDNSLGWNLFGHKSLLEMFEMPKSNVECYKSLSSENIYSDFSLLVNKK